MMPEQKHLDLVFAAIKAIDPARNDALVKHVAWAMDRHTCEDAIYELVQHGLIYIDNQSYLRLRNL